MIAGTDEARGLLAAASSAAVIGHLRPDGDAVGAVLALSLSLRKMGKQAVSVLADGVPERYRFLPGADEVQSRLEGGVDLFISVDCSDEGRLGFTPEEVGRRPDLNIDHHPTNTLFASVNLVDPEATSTTQVLYDLAPALTLPLDEEVATNLLAGFVNDTIGFRTPNVTAAVLRTAAELVELGAPLAELYTRVLLNQSFVAARYWGYGLARLQRDDGLLWTSLRLDDRRAVGYPGPDDADLVNHLGAIEGAQVIVVFVEQSRGKVKVSWRAKPGIDVSALAKANGGGGHHAAAGAMIDGDLESVQTKVLDQTRAALGLVQAADA